MFHASSVSYTVWRFLPFSIIWNSSSIFRKASRESLAALRDGPDLGQKRGHGALKIPGTTPKKNP